MRRNVLTLALLVFLNKCLIAEALDFDVPVNQSTINAAVIASNTAGGSNTLTVSANQTITAAITNVVANLAISGSSPAINVNLNGANKFNFAGTLGTYSVADLVLTGATNSALGLTGGNGLTITDVTLMANSAANGGAMNISGAAALSTISGSTFNQNTATTNGGAIYNIGTMNLNSGNIFSNNTAGGNGGAIANTGALTITAGNNFNNNQGKFGGAIHNSGNGVLTVNSGVSFTGNIIEAAAAHSQLGGGAIFNTGANALFNIDGVTFTGNRATPAIATNYGSGGAIYNVNSTADNTVTNSTFDSNVSQKNGGAIYNGGNLTVGQSSFTGNTSLTTALGGAIYSGGTLTLNMGNVFENNMAIDGTGGAVNAAGTFFEVTSNEFTQNSARTGGALAVGATSSTISDCTFTGNTATGNGGAIYVTKTSTITGSTFDSNQAGGSGGAIQVGGLGLDFLFTDNIFTNNKANSGAAIAHGSGNLVIDNCQFIANEAVTNSTVTLGISDTVTIGNSSFTNNITNGNSGGALNLNRSTLNLLPGNVFEGNIVYGVSSYGGGAIYSGSGTLTISDNQFISNSAPSGNSGAIHIQGSTNAATPTETFIEGSLFQANHAGKTGGAIMNHQQYAIMVLDAGNIFDSNTSVSGGGAVSNTGQLTVNADNHFLNNSVSNTNSATNTGAANGGAIYSNGANTSLKIDSSEFMGNSVENIGDSGSGTIINSNAVARGGAVVNNLSNNAANAISSSSFTNNSVLLEGINYYLGVLDVDYTLDNGPIIINASSGGAVYNSGTLSMSGALDFVNNSVEINDSTVLSTGVSLISGGGAIYNSGTMNISDTADFTDNSVTVQNTSVIAQGGAIFNNGGTLAINDASFTNNSSTGATAQGGAIYNTGAAAILTITEGDFDQNTSTYGGAIYNDTDAHFTLNGGSFSTNTATGLGGAIYNLGIFNLNSTLNDITFSGNSANGTANDIYGVTGSIININGAANSVVIDSGIAGMGTINKSNTGTLILNGNSSLYTGIFNQTGGNTVVSEGFFAGTSNIGGGIVEFTDGSSLPNNAVISLGSSGTVNITGSTDIAFDGKLTGNGVINKTSSGTLSVNGNDGAFVGTYNQTDGDTIVSETGRMFGGTNNISNSTLEVTTGLSVYYSANLGDNAILNNLSTTINGGSVSTGNINFTGTGAIATFTKDSSLPGKVNYSLGKIDNGQTNTIVFDNADVMLASTDYTGDTIYSFTDSIIDITSSTVRNIEFDNLNLANSELSFALSFDREPSGIVLTSDTLSATNVTGDSTIGINIIKVVNDNDTGLQPEYTVKVLDGLTFDPATTIQNIATIAYEYTAIVDPGDNTSILLSVIQASDENSLYKMNALDGNRGFNISFFIEGSEVYNIGQSLGITSEGTFVVQGFDTNPSHGVISGNIVDSLGQPTGEKGSLFKLSNITDLTVANLTISDAFVDGNGSVLFIDNADAVAVLENIFIQNNSSTGLGGAVYNDSGAVTINRDLLTSNKGAEGGAVYNSEGTLNVYSSHLNQNSATGDGGAIYNDSGTVTANHNVFTSNASSSDGGAIYNTGGELGLYNNSFNSNHAAVDGGAIYNTDTTTISGATSFTNNTAGENGGAIYNSGVLNLDSSYGNILFLGNTANGSPNDIYNDNATINIDGNTGNVAINDGITGTGTINKSNNGTLVLGGNNSNYTGDFNQTGGTTTVTGTFFSGPGDVSLINSTLNFGSQAHFSGTNNLTLDNAIVNSINGVVQTNTIANQLILGYGGANFNIDVNAFGGISDQYIIQNGITGTGTINISSINIVGQAPTAPRIPLLVFDASSIDAGIIFTATDKEIKTPIYLYKIISDGAGSYILIRVGNESAINKQAFRGQVATMSAYYNQLIVNNILFDHVYLESETLSASRYNNKYAAINPLFAPYQYNREGGSLWYKGYTTFETLSMTQNIDVRNYNYGSLVGADFPVKQLGDGWKFLPTTYIAYNGGHQTFDGVGMYQNGGQGGFMGTFMKDDVWISSILAYGGGYNNEMQVEGFNDRTGNWFAGTAMKTAYNYRASRNLIIQPTALVSYNIFGNQHWGSDFGSVSMVSGFLNGINVAPGLNVIYNKKTWGAYITTQYMYNINDKINGSIGTIDLPNLRMRHGYIEYGFGITKTWKERFLGYFQTTIRNAGRTGVTLQAGFAWKL